MSRRSPRFALLMVFLAGAACVGCGTRITLTADTELVGVSRSVLVKAESTSKEDRSFFWKSSDPSVLKMGGGGRGAAVWGMAPGTAEITAEGSDSGAIGRITLTVVPEEELPEEIAKHTPGGKLFHAAETRDLAGIDDLLAKGADPNYRAPHAGNMPVLTAATRAHQLAIVNRLLDAGADPDLRDDHGLTPLMHAAYSGNTAIIEVLLVRGGAKTNLKAKDGRSVLDCAFEGGHRQAFSQLVKAGARKTKTDAARQWLKQSRRFETAGRNDRIIAFVWLVLFLIALRPPSLYTLLARRRLYYKTVSGHKTVFVEADRATHTVRRKIETFPGVPPILTRAREAEAFEASADMEPASPLEFHQHWNWPYTTYTRWVRYLRLCALTVLSVPMFIIWIIVAHNRYSRVPPFTWLPEGGDAIFFIAIAAVAIPPLLCLLSIVAFVSLQVARPTPRQQISALAAGGAVLLGLAALVWLILQAATSLAG